MDEHHIVMQPPTAIGVLIYRTLLVLYPRTFHRQFASDMIQDFEEASHEVWTDKGWRGLLSLWLCTGIDVARGALLQWVRSGTLVASGFALITATSCAAVVSMIDPRVPYTMTPSSPERDGLLMLILVTTIIVVIAATIIFSLMFLRPALDRHAGRRRV